MRGIALVCLLGTSVAWADQSKADMLFDEGKQLETAGKWQEACDKFQAAIQLDPEAPGTLLNLGLCNEKLGKVATALAWYKKAEDHARTYKMAEYEQEASKRENAVSSRVPVIKIEFAQELPAGGQVTVDGKPLRAEDYARFTVDPGKHDIVVTAPHVKRVDQTVDLKEGGEQTIKVDTWVVTHAVTRDDGRTKRLAAYGLGAAGLVLYGVDLYIGFHERDIFDHTTDQQQKNDADHTVLVYSTTTFIAGTACIGLAAYLYFTAPKAETIEEVTWLPIVTRDQIGFAYDRRF